MTRSASSSRPSCSRSTERLHLPPRPYVLALATSANIGSAMSITGNPQNAMIGISGHFSFLGFLAHLAPVSVVCLLLDLGLLAFIFRRELGRAPLPAEAAAQAQARVDRKLLVKCLISAGLVLVLWAFNFDFPLVAISVAAVILLIGGVRSGSIHERVDWTLLLFFAALFVLIRGFELSGATGFLVERFEP